MNDLETLEKFLETLPPGKVKEELIEIRRKLVADAERAKSVARSSTTTTTSAISSSSTEEKPTTTDPSPPPPPPLKGDTATNRNITTEEKIDDSTRSKRRRKEESSETTVAVTSPTTVAALPSTTKARARPEYTDIHMYSYNDEGNTVSVFVLAKGVGKLPRNAVVVDFAENAFDLRIRDLKPGESWRLKREGLYGEIEPQASHFTTTKDWVRVTMKKVKKEPWPRLLANAGGGSSSEGITR